MDVFRTDDGLVGKYMHDDGSETAIKSVSSCDTVRDPATGKLHRNPVDRRKYSIFASGSAGCFMRCTFCYLTIKQAQYRKLEETRILDNLLEAVRAERDANPDIAARYAKICWMGMGEDHMMKAERTRRITFDLMNRLMVEGHALGLDGADLASVLPPGLDDDRWIEALSAMNEDLAAFPANPNNRRIVHASNDSPAEYERRTRVRLFWSLHSGNPETRSRLIPNARALASSAEALRRFRDETGLDLIVHHFFLDGITDTEQEADELVRFLEGEGLADAEFRILRYNSCANTPLHEAQRFDALAERIATSLPRVKVQISTGVEVRAACGQFIVRSFADPENRLGAQKT